MPTLTTLNLLLIRWFYSMVDLFTAICKYLSWSSASDCQGSVQIGSLTTLWHDHIACIDDTACPGRKTAFWYMSMRWTVDLSIKTINTFTSSQRSLENPTRFQTRKAAHTYMACIKEYPPPPRGFFPNFQANPLLGHLTMTKARSLWLCSAYGCSQGSLTTKRTQFRLTCVVKKAFAQNVQLVLHHCYKTRWAFYHLRIKPGLLRSQSFADYEKLLHRMWRVFLLIRG